MFVAASTRCFADLPLDAALQRLVDLEYTCVEIMIHEAEGHMKPSEVLADLDAAVRLCRQTHRLTPIAFSVDIDRARFRAALLRPVRRLLPAGQGEQSGDDHGPFGRAGHALQRRGRAVADGCWPSPRWKASASDC